MPKPENQRRIVDAYLAAFRRTPLVMLIGGGEMLKYATERGAGWRADCLGDMGGFSSRWNHMRNHYPSSLEKAGATNAWRTAPVAWETCWDMRHWVREGWSLRYIFNYALALHGSQFNNKSAPLPGRTEVRPEVERFLKRLGYRLVLREIQHPAEAIAGQSTALRMQWQNIGSAPCYRPYRLAYRLTAKRDFRGAKGDNTVLGSNVTVNRWLPGSVDLFTDEFFRQPLDLPPGDVVIVSDPLAVPADLPAGEYQLSLAVVAEDSPRPVVQLGIEGRAADGWYPLSQLRVVAE
jgi:hypothetical protein